MSLAAASPMEQERPCPGCQHRDHAPFAEQHIDADRLGEYAYASRKMPEFMCLRLVRCRHCDLVYAPTPPSGNALSAAYAEAAYDSAPEAEAAARTYAEALAPFIARLPERHAAIDVGAGSGPLLPWLSAAGFAPVLGIEPSKAAIEAAPAERRPALREGMFSAEQVADLSPSLIGSFMTLEHLDDPGAFVRTAHDLLLPGGMLAVVVHDWRAPLNRLLGRRSPIIDIEHLQLFSPQAIHQLLHRAGFREITCLPIANTYPLRYWLRLTPLPVALKTRLIHGLGALGLADLPLSFRVGNLLAVGYK